MTKTSDEVAKLFDADNTASGANLTGEVYPGYPALVLAGGKIRQMNWGFPLQRKGAKGQTLKPKPVNNARSDKLDGFFWRSSFAQRRCLIPLSAWAEAQGPKGAMTRTWMSLPGADLFACAGLWRASDEWGDCYSMVMTGSGGAAAEVHSRMPVIIAIDQYQAWLGGSPDDAAALCSAWQGGLDICRTDEPWSRGGQASLL